MICSKKGITLVTWALIIAASPGLAEARASKRRISKPTATTAVPQTPEADAATPSAPATPTSNEDTLRPAIAGDQRPWARGVAGDNQSRAAQLFREGNALLNESLFVKAAEKYREALRAWDHPGIHYNLALALLNLDQPLELLQHLDAAVKFGATALDEDKIKQSQRYKLLIDGQLASILIKCPEPGARVRMDGRDLFIGPGEYQSKVRVGPHTVVATKDGFLTNEVSRSLEPRSQVVLEMKLMSTADLTRYRRKWPVAAPWLVFGGGALLGLAGGGMHLGASLRFAAFDRGIIDCNGCVPAGALAADRRTGEILRVASISAYGVAATALVTSAILLYVNRLRPYQVNAQGEEQPEP